MALAQRTSVNLRIVEAGQGNLEPERLVPFIAAGNELAMSQFYEATSGLLFGLLLLNTGDTASAEKVLAEVYAEVRQQAARFNKSHESLLIWLVTLAHRRALEHLCSSSEGQQFAVSVGLAGKPSSGAARRFGINKSAHRRLVGRTLDCLSPREQKMIELTYFSGMTSHAVAAKLRQSPEAVNIGIQYGVLRLYNLFRAQ